MSVNGVVYVKKVLYISNTTQSFLMLTIHTMKQK